jgi:RNA polymerase sigma-70 factor (ECF subfamily)
MQTTPDKLATFSAHKGLLHSLAYQLLGNASDAEDMVQETFIRWQKAEDVRSPKAYLTTIVTRLCLKHLQSTRVRHETCMGGDLPEELLASQIMDPGDHSRLAESLSTALLVMLESLSPLERAVFLLREVFDCDYTEIGRIVDKTEDNCRQILRRARERVAGRQQRFEVTPEEQENILQRFLKASANGQWQELIDILAENATVGCDGGDLRQPSIGPIIGAVAAGEFIHSRAHRWIPSGALFQTFRYESCPIVVVFCGAEPVAALAFSFSGNKVKSLTVITCQVRLRSWFAQQSSGETPKP